MYYSHTSCKKQSDILVCVDISKVKLSKLRTLILVRIDNYFTINSIRLGGVGFNL